MNERLTRYADLIPRVVTLDAASADSMQGELFNILGGGAGDVRDRSAAAELGFAAIASVRRAAGRACAPYTHDGAEVFVAHTGHWRLRFGPNGADGGLELAQGDVVSVCPGVFRCMDKPDDEDGCMLILRGTPDALPECVTRVFERVADADSPCLTRVKWIDTSSGAPVLQETTVTHAMAPPWDGAARAAGRKNVSYVAAATDMKSNGSSPLCGKGIEECGVIVPQRTRDCFEPSPSGCWWPHGFNLRLLILKSGAYAPLHTRAEPEVFFVQEGSVQMQWSDGAIMLGAGDTLSVPVGLAHALRNTTSRPTRLFVIRGAKDPEMPIFLSMPPHVGMSAR